MEQNSRHSGICEYYHGERALQILPQIRAYKNSVPELRNPSADLKNTVGSYSWIVRWVALGLGSHILQFIRIVQVCNCCRSTGNLSRRTRRLDGYAAAHTAVEAPVRFSLRGAGAQRRCPRCWVLPGHCEAKAAGAPRRWKSCHCLNHQQSLVNKICSWYPMKSRIAVSQSPKQLVVPVFLQN